MTVAESETQESGALLRRQPPGAQRSCLVLLLERCPKHEQHSSTGIYYRAFVTWDSGRYEYDPAFLLVPFSTSIAVVVDPRKM